MKAIKWIIFIIGMCLGLLDVDNMALFFISKIIAVLCILFVFITTKPEE